MHKASTASVSTAAAAATASMAAADSKQHLLSCRYASVSGGATTSSSANGTKCGCDCSTCTYCQQSLGAVAIKCSECVNFLLCLKVSMSLKKGFLFLSKIKKTKHQAKIVFNRLFTKKIESFISFYYWLFYVKRLKDETYKNVISPSFVDALNLFFS